MKNHEVCPLAVKSVSDLIEEVAENGLPTVESLVVFLIRLQSESLESEELGHLGQVEFSLSGKFKNVTLRFFRLGNIELKIKTDTQSSPLVYSLINYKSPVEEDFKSEFCFQYGNYKESIGTIQKESNSHKFVGFTTETRSKHLWPWKLLESYQEELWNEIWKEVKNQYEMKKLLDSIPDNFISKVLLAKEADKKIHTVYLKLLHKKVEQAVSKLSKEMQQRNVNEMELNFIAFRQISKTGAGKAIEHQKEGSICTMLFKINGFELEYNLGTNAYESIWIRRENEEGFIFKTVKDRSGNNQREVKTQIKTELSKNYRVAVLLQFDPLLNFDF